MFDSIAPARHFGPSWVDIFTKITRETPVLTLSCEEINHFIVDFLDGEANEPARIAVEAHLRHCADCATFLDQYRTTIRLARKTRDPAVPEGMTRRIIEFLQDHYDDM